MSHANSKTIETYNKSIQAYIDGTPQQTSGFQKKWLDEAIVNLAPDAAILEIGSAFGRDAHYLMSQGYAPEVTDVTLGFVEYLNERGFDARVLDIVNQQPEKKYDLILACAVFLHFTEDDFTQAIRHVSNSLNPEGRFAFSLKYGEGEEWIESKVAGPRYFHYWKEGILENRLGDLGMRSVVMKRSDDGKWLYAVAVNAK